MYTVDTRIDIDALLSQIVRSYLLSAVSGASLESFIRHDENADILRSEFSRIRETLEEREQELEDVRSQLTVAVSSNSITHSRTIKALLERALTLMDNNDLHALENLQVEEDVMLEFEDLYDIEVNPEPHEEEELVTFVPQEAESVQEAESQELDLDLEDEDFDLEDEDLDGSQSTPLTSSEDLTKNPEISENFTNLEDGNMVMLVYVKYSHLPYHYISDGLRRKFVLNGSQIVSATV
jgi:hypothetical protein